MSTYTLFHYPIQIREHHLDTFGHVNNAVYLEILEESRWEILNQNGYGLQKVHQSGLGPVILEIHLLFSKELRLHDKITIHTQMISYVGKICELKQWMLNAAGELCCEARFKIGLFDTKSRKLVLPTTEWLNALGAV